MLTPIEVIYQSLGIRQKLQDQKLRVLYLREVWGLEQTVIGKLEDVSQPKISNILKEGNQGYSEQDIKNLFMLQFDIEEIKYLQRLPWEVVNDAQLISFVTNILGLVVLHPYYYAFGYGKGVRVAALASLGVRQKTLSKIFKLSQPAISKTIKRNAELVNKVNISFQRIDYNSTALRLAPSYFTQSQQFQLAGGQTR